MPYVVIGVLGVAVEMPFLRVVDGVADVFFLRDGAGSFIRATSPGPGGRSVLLGTLRVELLKLRRGVSVDDTGSEVGDGKNGGEDSGEEDGERICACGAGVKGLCSGGRLERK